MKRIPELSLETAGSINPPTSVNRQSCLPSCMIKSARSHLYFLSCLHASLCFVCLFLRKGLTVNFKLSWTHCDIQTGLVTMQSSCLSFLNAEITSRSDYALLKRHVLLLLCNLFCPVALPNQIIKGASEPTVGPHIPKRRGEWEDGSFAT